MFQIEVRWIQTDPPCFLSSETRPGFQMYTCTMLYGANCAGTSRIHNRRLCKKEVSGSLFFILSLTHIHRFPVYPTICLSRFPTPPPLPANDVSFGSSHCIGDFLPFCYSCMRINCSFNKPLSVWSGNQVWKCSWEMYESSLSDLEWDAPIHKLLRDSRWTVQAGQSSGWLSKGASFAKVRVAVSC